MPDTSLAIGIDIGGTNLRAARVSGAGEILERVSERIDRDANNAIGRIIELVRQLDNVDVTAIGIGVPGRVDARRRTVLSGGYLNLAGAALAERVEVATGKPVIIDNDCNMALVAEIAAGAGRGRENVVMFTIGTGIGGAIVQEGQILRGRGTAGQLGHITVDVQGAACVCGRRGCVETTSSGTALARHIQEASLPADTSVDDILRRAAKGNAAARRVLDAWAGPLRAAIDSASAAFDPDLVLLGGGLGKAAFKALQKVPALAPWYQYPVLPAALGDDAGVIGAAFCALIEHREPLLPPSALVATKLTVLERPA
ncbi:ROK family protein [Kaistia terrae]|uniref:ROK family protein n=1 Tax=Kaistia terrae TaxID=537017 RepID=A0ABW0Q0K3_9HYPH|nr:ROK family protein [Kaistia terrae]MCX5578778.1 ROK family protein [Kaistia terrae]